YVATWAATSGFQPVRHADSAHPSIVPFQSFRTLDGTITVACAKDAFWRRLCTAIDRADLASDPRYQTFADRAENRDQLLAELRTAFASRTTDAWLDLLGRAGVPVGAVNDVDGALTDPQTVARGAVIEVDHPAFPSMRQVASPLRVGSEPRPAR